MLQMLQRVTLVLMVGCIKTSLNLWLGNSQENAFSLLQKMTAKEISLKFFTAVYYLQSHQIP